MISLACTSIVISAHKMLLVNFGKSPRTRAARLFKFWKLFCSNCSIACKRSPSVAKQAVTSAHHIVCDTVKTTWKDDVQISSAFKAWSEIFEYENFIHYLPMFNHLHLHGIRFSQQLNWQSTNLCTNFQTTPLNLDHRTNLLPLSKEPINLIFWKLITIFLFQNIHLLTKKIYHVILSYLLGIHLFCIHRYTCWVYL